MLEIYIGQSCGGWASDGRTQAWATHADPVAGLERWIAEIEAGHASRWRKARVDLWLSGGLVRPFLCGPVEGLGGWKEAEALAVAGVADATGLQGACRVRLEDWPGDAPAIATALDAALADAIDTFAKSRRIVWRSVRPRWAAALDDLAVERESVKLFALAEEDALTLLCTSPDDAGFGLASSYSPPPDQAQTQALLHRLTLSHDVAPDDAWFARLETDASAAALGGEGRRRAAWPGAARIMKDAQT